MNAPSVPASRLVSFVAGATGPWCIERIVRVAGDSAQVGLPVAAWLSVVAGSSAGASPGTAWCLRGTTSNDRYVRHDEKARLVDLQEGLGRPASRHAALIPIRKTAAWWALAQDVRRDLFEAQSHHIAIGMKYLPAVARRLHHCRDLGLDEPFDFLTWFEYAADDSDAFDALLTELRASPEWRYVDREVDVRLSLDAR